MDIQHSWWPRKILNRSMDRLATTVTKLQIWILEFHQGVELLNFINIVCWLLKLNCRFWVILNCNRPGSLPNLVRVRLRCWAHRPARQSSLARGPGPGARLRLRVLLDLVLVSLTLLHSMTGAVLVQFRHVPSKSEQAKLWIHKKPKSSLNNQLSNKDLLL